MAEQSPSTPPKTSMTSMAESNSNQSEPDHSPNPPPQSDPSLTQQSSTPPPPPPPPPHLVTPTIVPQPASLRAPPLIPPYASSAIAVVSPSVPSFRPVTQTGLQFALLPPNPSLPQARSYQTPTPAPVGVPPPGVMLPTPPNVALTGQIPLGSSVTVPYAQPGQHIRAPYAPMPNGYPAIPQAIPPPGILRYPTPYAPIIRSAYPPRPVGASGVLPPLLRPPIAGFRAPLLPPVVRPPGPNVTAAEKQTTVYVGKIASSVENEFILALLQLCGSVKSWKRPQNPTDGTYKGFGFCEFESAEGVLRALRLLSKLNMDGQELMLNVNQATREYLEQFVEKKVESLKTPKEVGTETETEPESESIKKDEVGVSGDKKIEALLPSAELPKPDAEESGKDGNGTTNKESSDASSFGLVTDEDRQADREAVEKLTGMIEERLKNKPLPPPPAHAVADGSSNSNLEVPARSKDGEMDVDGKEAAEDKNENEMTSESKPLGEVDRSETSSPDRDRRQDKRSRDRERDMKREKERELERYERDREQERAKREKEREYRLRDDERRFKAREKEWESREKEKEHWRQREKEREKERVKGRKEEITAQERESDGGYSKKRKYRSGDEERRRRQREKEEDVADRLKEEEEIAEAKWRAEEEQKRKQQEEELKALSGNRPNGNVLPEEMFLGGNEKVIEQQDSDCDLGAGDGDLQNGIGEEVGMTSLSSADGRQNSSAPAKRLGFGLQGSGKRTTVPSVFNEDEDEDLQKEKKMRPLVPIDYSTEEQLAVHSSMSEAPPSNLVAATEFVRRVSGITPRDERPDKEKERTRRSHDRSGLRDRDRSSDEVTRNRDESRKEGVDHNRVREAGVDRVKTNDNQKLLDAKQLIDMIPKTKDELFSYEINWTTYDKNSLHERMKPWIAKKITEFLGEEEPTLVDYVMSSTREHVAAAEMLNRLQGILDEEAEMFVLKMWRMLIFEIKRVETGLALRSRA